jgi:hypothetical protein
VPRSLARNQPETAVGVSTAPCLHRFVPEAQLAVPRQLKVVLASLFCIAGFRLAATAQVQTYSADSLMATFEKASKLSLKGSEITFSDVVVEQINSRVIFKSSQSDRVFCDLSALTGNNTPHVSIGSLVRVTGKVRGRGLLGNVTLDNCKLAPVVAASADTIPQENPSVPADAVAVIPDEPAPVDPVLERHPEPATDVVPARNMRQASPVTKTLPGEPVQSGEVAHPNLEIEHVDNAPRSTPAGADFGKRRVPYTLYVLLFLIGAAASSVFSKLLMPRLRGVQWSKPENRRNTPETRQAALEALLLKSAKKQ